MALHRGLRITIRILAGLFLALALGVGWLAWRLANDHPIHLGFLVPMLQRSLATADLPIRFELDDIIFAWAPGKRPPGLRVIGLHGYAADGRKVANIREFGFTISLRALSHGLLAPASIDVLAPAINLRRNPDGQLAILSGGDNATPAESRPTGAQVVEELLAPPDPTRITGYLREVRISGGSLSLDDRVTGRTWHAPEVDLDLIRGKGEIRGHLSVELQELGNPASIDAEMVLSSATRSLQLSLRFGNVDLPQIASLRPILASAAGLHVTVDGQIDTSVAVDGSLGDLRFTLASGRGSIDLPGILADPLDISKLSLAGSLSAGFDRLAIDSLVLGIGDSVLKAQAQASGLTSSAGGPGQLRVKGGIDVTHLPVAELSRLWPLSDGKSTGGRDWVAGQLEDGTIGHAQASVELAFPGGDLTAPQILAFGGTFEASGVRVHYLRPLPPIEGASATARFDSSSLVVDVQSGGVGQLLIQKARVTITGLDAADQSLELEGDVAGPLRDVLALLNDPSLGYLRGTGIRPDASSGKISANLALKFPLLKELPLSSLDGRVKARIEEARLDKVFAGQDLSGGNFDLDLNSKGTIAAGQALFAGLPVTLRWEESFTDREPLTLLSVRARPDAKELARLGLNLHGAIQGALPGEVIYRRFARQPAELGIDADLTPAAIALDFARWQKPPGVAGRATATLELAGFRPSRISAFSLNAGDAAAEGRGSFTESGGFREIVFDRLNLGKTRLTGAVLSFSADRIDARVGGGQFDAGPYIDKAVSLGVRGSARGAPASSDAPFAYALAPSHFNRILLGEGREIDSLRLSFAYDGAHFESIEADGNLLGGGTFTFGWLPAPPSAHRLSVIASDAGAALKALDIFDSAAGGHLTLTGTSEDGAPGRPIQGHMEITEYRLLGQSALWRLLTVATLTGIADMMTGDGLLMRRFYGDFTKTDARVDVPLARTFGPSLAVTAKGYFDLAADSIDIQGTVVPANALNSLIGSVPLIGFLITGGQNGGLGSVTYTATGKLSQPTLSVNPLSALSPGFLKALFDLPGSDASQPSAMPPGAGGN